MPTNQHGDPRLKTPQWRAIVAWWNQQQPTTCEATTCKLRRRPIRYGGKRGPDSLDVGHRQPRATDPRPVWTIADTRPEHARCNRSAGNAIGKARRAARQARAAQPLAISLDDW